MTSRKLVLVIGLLLVCIALFWHTCVRQRMAYPSAIVVHESASCWGDASDIREWHHQRGWRDIGYHAVILNGRRSRTSAYDPQLDGKIEPGRPENWLGSHCEADDMNSRALGVCLIGFPGRAGYPTKQQVDALVHYCAIKCWQYGIPVSAITQHSDHEPLKPLCASLNMAEIRRRVEEKLERLRQSFEFYKETRKAGKA